MEFRSQEKIVVVCSCVIERTQPVCVDPVVISGGTVRTNTHCKRTVLSAENFKMTRKISLFVFAHLAVFTALLPLLH